MHFLIALFWILVSLKWGNWKNWRAYHATMLYFSAANLFYYLIVQKDWLWVHIPDKLTRYFIFTDPVHIFISQPFACLVFLSTMPKKKYAIVLHHIKFIAIFTVFEWFYLKTDYIAYQNGWNLWWSLVFNFVMFPMLLLHHWKLFLAFK